MPASAVTNSGKKWTMTELERMRLRCDRWNKLYMVGSNVYIRLDSGKVIPTKTRAKAIVNGNRQAVIWVENVAGCYPLDRVWPRAFGLVPDEEALAKIGR